MLWVVYRVDLVWPVIFFVPARVCTYKCIAVNMCAVQAQERPQYWWWPLNSHVTNALCFPSSIFLLNCVVNATKFFRLSTEMVVQFCWAQGQAHGDLLYISPFNLTTLLAQSCAVVPKLKSMSQFGMHALFTNFNFRGNWFVMGPVPHGVWGNIYPTYHFLAVELLGLKKNYKCFFRMHSLPPPLRIYFSWKDPWLCTFNLHTLTDHFLLFVHPWAICVANLDDFLAKIHSSSIV